MPNSMTSDTPPGGLVHLLSAPAGSLCWAVGMRKEIQACAGQPEVDSEYLGHCLRLLLRTGGWRLLRDARLRRPSRGCLCPLPRRHR